MASALRPSTSVARRSPSQRRRANARLLLQPSTRDLVAITPRGAAPSALQPAPSIDAALHRWDARVTRRQTLVAFIRGLSCALPVAVVLTVSAKLGAVPSWSAVAVPAAVLVTIVAGTRRRRDLDETARLLDHDLGLSACLTTARELERVTVAAARSPLERAVIDEARAAADPSRPVRIRIRTSRPLLLAVATGAVMLIAAVVAPYGGGDTATAAHRAATLASPAGTTTHTGGGGAADVRGGETHDASGSQSRAGAVQPARHAAAAKVDAFASTPAVLRPPAAAERRAGLRGGRVRADASATRRAPAPTTDRAASTQGKNRGVAPVKQPTGTHRIGNIGIHGTRSRAVGEGAAGLAAGRHDKRSGDQAANGKPGSTGHDPDPRGDKGTPTSRTGGTPATQKRKGAAQSAQQGQAGTGTSIGNSRGHGSHGQATTMRAPRDLPLAAGFKPGRSTGSQHGRASTGPGNGDGRGRGRTQQGSATAGDSDGGAAGFALPDARSGPGLSGSLFLHYFGS
ncbi:MAG TPA: hypothetical protein VGM91_08335 [Conexibacter sp.]|jgi:hypothetical protein